MELDLKGRRAVVTGASAGIGRAIALALAAEGVDTFVTARRRDALESLGDEIVAAGGTAPHIHCVDFTAEAAPDQIAGTALAALGTVEILVNNAGGSRGFGADATDEQWEEAMTLNFVRHRQLTTRLLPTMRANGWGRVISITGKSEPDGVNGANAAKAAMHAWGKGLSREVGSFGITVNSVAPGRIESEQINRNYSKEYRAFQEANEIPMGRYGQPSDIANLVCYLASPRAQYITGTVIPVDGGLRRYQY